MNTIDRTDKIDDFLLGNMSEEEKKEFERLLSDDDTSLVSKQLKHDMELQQEIILAIKERGLKELLQKEESKLQAERQKKKGGQRILDLSVHILSPLAIAACLFGVFIHMPQVSNMDKLCSETGLFVDAHMDIQNAYSGLRGCEDVASVIMSADSLMQVGAYERADNLLAHEIKVLGPVAKEESQLWAEKEDMLYMQALCAIQRKQVYRSRALLVKVKEMNGMHAEHAQNLINQIKGKK